MNTDCQVSELLKINQKQDFTIFGNMIFPPSGAIAAALVAIGTYVAEGCPFAASESSSMPDTHPFVPNFQRRLQEGDDSMFAPDGRLVGSPSLANGGFEAGGLLVPMRDDGSTIADVVAELGSQLGTDMCLIRFQQLPPPAVGNFSFDQNAADRLDLKLYGEMMVDRFYQLSGPDVNDGGIIFSAVTIGSGGVEAFCNAGIEPERWCDERLMRNSVRWSQAITGYKLTNKTVDAVKAVISTWRTTDGGHLPSMLWSWNGGNPDVGGSQVGIWGNEGGLFSKIVRCDDIPEKLMYFQYPNDTATGDFIDSETNETISELMYQWWTEYGGFNYDGEQVFGEAPDLPIACASCVGAASCFDETGCTFLDFESQTWAAPYDACTPAFTCIGCFPECTAQAPAECEACVGAAPCFDETGCGFLDFESQTWAAPYDACTPAFACLGCFPECTEPGTGGCADCLEAAPCFGGGCEFLDFESKTWSAPYGDCAQAYACLECFPECTAEATEVPAPPTMAPVASTTPPVAATPAPADSGAISLSATAMMVLMMATISF